MDTYLTHTMVKDFFLRVLKELKKSNREVNRVRYELSEVKELFGFEDEILNELTYMFQFLNVVKGNYTKYLEINKLAFIFDAINQLNTDIQQLSGLLNFNTFEILISEFLERNNYFVTTNFRFSDKSNFKYKTNQKRYEIDVIALKRKHMFVIDAKQWRKKDVFSSMNNAANLQYQRVTALKHNPDVLSHLIHKLFGPSARIKKHLPLSLIPMMVSIEDNWIRINENKVPLVSIAKFNSFLQEFENMRSNYNEVIVNKISIQKQLF